MEKPHRIGIILDMARSYSQKLFQGAISYARETGNIRFATHPAHPHFDELKKCDGVILQFITSEKAQIDLLRDVPTVWVLSHLQCSEDPILRPDDREVGRLAANYLLKRGYGYFGFVTDNPNAEFSRLRYEGFIETVRANGHAEFTYPDLPAAREKGTVETDLSHLPAWLESTPKPIGIMASHDTVGRQLMKTISHSNFHVPENIAVVGVDNDERFCETVSPPLSSIALPLRTIGYEAAQLLTGMINGEEPKRQTYLYSPLDVVTRASSDSLAVDDPHMKKALKFIRNHATGNLTVQKLVNHVPLSRRSLERRFQESFGRTPHEVIIFVRVQMAKRYLADTNWLMRQVAARSGFQDASKLSSWFKTMTGLTPSEYRHKYQTP